MRAHGLPAARLDGRPALVRLQTWHKAVLPGEPASPYGVLLNLRTRGELPAGPFWTMRIVEMREAAGDLLLDMGGGTALAFSACRPPDRPEARAGDAVGRIANPSVRRARTD